MDGHGWGETANDDGSGTALVMGWRASSNAPDVRTDRTLIPVRALEQWRLGLTAAALSPSAAACRGKESPAGSGRYPRTALAGRDPARHDDDWNFGMPRPRRHDVAERRQKPT